MPGIVRSNPLFCGWSHTRSPALQVPKASFEVRKPRIPRSHGAAFERWGSTEEGDGVSNILLTGARLAEFVGKGLYLNREADDARPFRGRVAMDHRIREQRKALASSRQRFARKTPLPQSA